MTVVLGLRACGTGSGPENDRVLVVGVLGKHRVLRTALFVRGQ